MKTSTTKPLIWKPFRGNTEDLICEPEKDSLLRVEKMGSGRIWYMVVVGENLYDSFFGETAHTLEDAKRIATEVYQKFKKGETVNLLLHNKLPM